MTAVTYEYTHSIGYFQASNLDYNALILYILLCMYELKHYCIQISYTYEVKIIYGKTSKFLCNFGNSKCHYFECYSKRRLRCSLLVMFQR